MTNKWIQTDKLSSHFDGQFVVTWKYDDVMWSGTYRRDGNCVERYSTTCDDWVLANGLPWRSPMVTDVQFYVLAD